jgi:hypothetical protein
VTRVLYICIFNTPTHFHEAKPNGSGKAIFAKEQEKETERDSRQVGKDHNTKGTRCITKKEHGAKNGRLEEVKLDQETSLPIHPVSLSIVQVQGTGHKLKPSILDGTGSK